MAPIAIAMASAMPSRPSTQPGRDRPRRRGVTVASTSCRPARPGRTRADGHQRPPAGPPGRLSSARQLVAAERPGREADERKAGDHLDRRGGQGEREGGAEDDGPGMDDERRDRHGEQDGERPITRRERERHQLALVAELGDEDHAGREQEGVHRAPLVGSGPEAMPSTTTRGVVSAGGLVRLYHGPRPGASAPAVDRPASLLPSAIVGRGA